MQWPSGWGAPLARWCGPPKAFKPCSTPIPSPCFLCPKRPSGWSPSCATPKKAGPDLPIERDGVQILKRLGNDVLTAYVPHPKGPVFMVMLEKAFGKDITTRTLDTVRKCLATA
jgi:hypothetical protein